MRDALSSKVVLFSVNLECSALNTSTKLDFYVNPARPMRVLQCIRTCVDSLRRDLQDHLADACKSQAKKDADSKELNLFETRVVKDFTEWNALVEDLAQQMCTSKPQRAYKASRCDTMSALKVSDGDTGFARRQTSAPATFNGSNPASPKSQRVLTVPNDAARRTSTAPTPPAPNCSVH